MTTSSVRLIAGAAFGPYTIVERLPGIALAERYRALGPGGRPVVLHLFHQRLSKDFAFRALLTSNANKAASLEHPNIASIAGQGEADGRWYVAAQDVAGEDLATRLASLRAAGERAPRQLVRRVGHAIGAALDHAHAQGVVHGDVRPSNVILSSSGAFLTGFAVARSLRIDSADRIAVGPGSPEYMAPEQADGKPADAAADRYALGVIAYEMLTGRTPYSGGPPLGVLLAHGKEPLPLPTKIEPRVGPATERVLLRALAVDPKDRHPDGKTFAGSLDQALEADPEVAAAAARSGGAAVSAAAGDLRRAQVRGGVIGAGTALVLSAIAVVAFIGVRPASPPSATADPVAVAPVPTIAPTPAPTAPPVQTAAPTVAVVPPPAPTGPATGALLFEAKLDGTAELDDVHVFSGGRSDAAITFARGAMELAVLRPRGGVIGFFRTPASTSYAGVFSVALPRTSEVLFTWALRRDGDESYLLRLDARTETLSLVYDDGVGWREALAPQVKIDQLRSGRAVPIAFGVQGDAFAVYVDGRRVVEARDARIARATLPLDVFVGDEGGVGSIRVLSARLYASR